MVLAPIAILAAVLLYANTKLRRGLGDQLLEDDDAAAEPDPSRDEPPAGEPIEAATPNADPSTST